MQDGSRHAEKSTGPAGQAERLAVAQRAQPGDPGHHQRQVSETYHRGQARKDEDGQPVNGGQQRLCSQVDHPAGVKDGVNIRLTAQQAQDEMKDAREEQPFGQEKDGGEPGQKAEIAFGGNGGDGGRHSGLASHQPGWQVSKKGDKQPARKNGGEAGAGRGQGFQHAESRAGAQPDLRDEGEHGTEHGFLAIIIQAGSGKGKKRHIMFTHGALKLKTLEKSA